MTITELAGGRVLDVDVTGPADGMPLIYHHGTPGSRIQGRGLARAAHARGLRLVTYSRSGYGASPRRPRRRVADVADDVRALLDHLDAPRCVTAGKSGGGPHALATAALLPDRVAGVASIAGVGAFGVDDLDFLAGMGELNVVEFGHAVQGEDSLRPSLAEMAPGLAEQDPAAIVREMRTLLPPVDVAVLTDEYGEDTAAGMAEAVRTGVDGWVDDDLAFTRPWGFELADVVVPTFVWQGDADLMVPFAHGEWLAKHLPSATAHLLPGEGHMSIAVGAAEQILDELVATL